MPFLPWAVDDLASSSVALEVLICDDGSRDGSTEWLETLQSRVENQAGCDVMRSTSLSKFQIFSDRIGFLGFLGFVGFVFPCSHFVVDFSVAFDIARRIFGLQMNTGHTQHTLRLGWCLSLINFCCRVKTVTSCANPLVAFQSPFFFFIVNQCKSPGMI